MRSRRGVSLVELVITMSACAVILTLSAELIHRLLLAHSRACSFHDAERTSLRLSRAFRNDVHNATEAEHDADAQNKNVFLRLTLADGRTIEYGRTDDAIQRRAFDGDTLRGREQFDFPSTIVVASRQEPSGQITLVVENRPAEQTPEKPFTTSPALDTPIHLEIHATIGRNAMAGASPAGSPE